MRISDWSSDVCSSDLRTRSAQGGPFIPYKSPDGIDPQFAQLNNALDRLDRLENTLLAIPSGRPTNVVMLSSGFGYRHDPFNGRGAFHAGLDFRGDRKSTRLNSSH